MTDSTVRWLLESSPWVNYRTRTDLLDEKLTESETKAIRRGIRSHPSVKTLLSDLETYFPKVATRHTDAKLSHYKLRMLVDFGLTADSGLSPVLRKVRAKRTDGLYAIRQLLPVKGENRGAEWNALPCDNPLLLYILMKSGDDDEQTIRQVQQLKDHWKTPSGWFCHLPFVESQFKKEQAGCPMAGLLALEVFSMDGSLRESKYAENAFAALTHHFDIGKSIYYFGRGRKFFTFKYPYVWYNALYLSDVLTRFEFTKKHPIVAQLIDWLRTGADAEGRYTPTSVFLEYKDWDFGNKKRPSPWLTYLCHKIIRQYERGKLDT